jgi:hypothetical protein
MASIIKPEFTEGLCTAIRINGVLMGAEKA